jgi:hypothetical protein
MMEAASTSETSVNFCQNTRRNIPEDSHLRTHRRENLKSHPTKFKIKFWKIKQKEATLCPPSSIESIVFSYEIFKIIYF